MEPDTGELPFAAGAVAGGLAWVAGYAVTAAVVFGQSDGANVGDVADAADGASPGAVVDFVGWVFFNAHFVDTVVEGGVAGFAGSGTASYVGGDGLTPALYLVPVGALLAAGLATARYRGAEAPLDGAVAGAFVVPPYLALCVLGAVTFRFATDGLVSFAGRPELLPAVLVAGLVYPAVCGAAGGALGGATAS